MREYEKNCQICIFILTMVSFVTCMFMVTGCSNNDEIPDYLKETKHNEITEKHTSKEEYYQSFISAISNSDIEKAKEAAIKYYDDKVFVGEISNLILCEDDIDLYRSALALVQDDTEKTEPGELIIFHVISIKDNNVDDTRHICLILDAEANWTVISEGR